MKTGYQFLVLAICVVFMCLLMGCQKEGQNSIPAQSDIICSEPNGETVSIPTQSTPHPTEDSDIRYFTLEEFESVIVGESTLEDVWEITEKPYWVAMTSYGGFSEYPMRDGNCIRIEYTMGYVVQTIEVTAPTVNPHNTNTNTDSGSHNPIGFADYDRYIAFFREQADEQPISELYTSKNIKDYIQHIRDGKLPLMIPYHGGAPLAIQKADSPFVMPIYILCELFVGTRFDTIINENEVSVCIYALSAEDAALAQKMSCPELMTKLKPHNSNVGNYDAKQYKAVFEDTADIDGAFRSMLVKQSTNGMENMLFVIDDCLIDIYAPTGIVTKDWLKDFSIEPA